MSSLTMFVNRPAARFALSTLVSAGAYAVAHPANAALVTYAFTGNSAAPTSNAATNVQAGPFSIGNAFGTVANPIGSTSQSGGYTVALTGTPASAGGNIGNAVSASNDASGSLSTATSSFFQVTLSPDANFQLTLSRFDFAARSTGTGAKAYSLRSSLDNYASDLASGTIPNTSTYVYLTNPLSSPIVSAAPVTLRLYAFNGATNAGNGTINTRLDDIVLDVAAASVGGTSPTVSLTDTGTATLGTVTVPGSAATGFAIQNVATGGATSGTLEIAGPLASTSPILVYLDRADDAAAIGTVSGATLTTGTFNFGNGVTYDALLTFSANPNTDASAFFTFSGFPAISNIGVVPEPTALLGLVAPAMLLLARRR